MMPSDFRIRQDWFWAKYGADGTAMMVGKPKGCIGCHGTRAGNDFVVVHEFSGR